jgi:hypothetical protein
LWGIGEEPMWYGRAEGDLTQRTQRSERRGHREDKEKPHPENRRVRHPLLNSITLEARRKLLGGFGFGLVEG